MTPLAFKLVSGEAEYPFKIAVNTVHFNYIFHAEHIIYELDYCSSPYIEPRISNTLPTGTSVRPPIITGPWSANSTISLSIVTVMVSLANVTTGIMVKTIKNTSTAASNFLVNLKGLTLLVA